MVSATTSDPLALDLWPASATNASRYLGDAAEAGGSGNGGLMRLEEYVRGLEEERSKMEGFRRELPLCILILTHVIEGLKEELARRGCGDAIAVKVKVEGEGQEVKLRKVCPEKVKWMSSARLWSPNYGVNTSSRDDARKNDGELGLDDPPSQQAPRKVRRCWSAELHGRFINAIEQLGGSQAATPKQIRQLMKVDGLTNDEVKSHLQKYRLRGRSFPLPVSSSPATQTVALWGDLQVTKEIPPLGKQRTSQTQSGSPSQPPSTPQRH